MTAACRSRGSAWAAALWVLASAVHAEEPAAPTPSPVRGELRLRWDGRAGNRQGPLAEANALRPGIAPATPDAATAEAGLHAEWQPRPFTLVADGLAWHQRTEGGGGSGGGRVNELHVGVDAGAWALGAGKKVLGWDVGYGFRPNDVVQQEQRRTLYAAPLEGRPLVEVEHFGADDAATLVWVNPQRVHDAADATRGAGESALAGRWYRRSGALDAYLFGRAGRHTVGSAGAALAWVSGDALELHASWRVLARHDGWVADSGAAPGSNPWRVATRGGTAQWLVGGQWTGSRQQSVLVEAWHDGTALPDAEWQARGQRSRALAASALPAAARAGSLAWQATPFEAPSLRQDNLFVRLAWQPGPWTVSADALLQPEDRGAIVTAALQWQGDRVRVNLALRQYGGAADALVRQLPQRRMGLAAIAWSF